MAENEGGGGNNDSKNPIDPASARTIKEVTDNLLLMNTALEDGKITGEELTQIYGDHLEATKAFIEAQGLSLESEEAKLELAKEAVKEARKDIEAQKKSLALQLENKDINKEAYRLKLQSLGIMEKQLEVQEARLGIEKKLSWQDELRKKSGEAIWQSLMKQKDTLVSMGDNMNDWRAELSAVSTDALNLEETFMDMNSWTDTFTGDLQGAQESWAKQVETIKSLNEGMTNLADIGKDRIQELAFHAGAFKRLGVDAQTTGQIVQESMQQWGMSANDAMKVQLELAGAAMKTGIPVGKMMKDFSSALPKLEKHGKGARKEFIKLQAISKKTGISVDSLMGAMERFDTIDGAAEAAANLNTVLGLNLNAMDLQTMTEAERAMHIKEQLTLSGKQIDNMNRMEKLAAAEAMGMSVGEFSKMMRASESGMESMVKSAENATMTIEDVAKKSAEAQLTSERKEKLDQAAIGNSKELAAAMGSVSKSIDNAVMWFSILGPAMQAVLGVGLSMLLERAKEGFLGFFKEGVEEGSEAVEDAGPKVKSFMSDVGEGIKDVGKSATANAKGILAFGAAFLMMGAGVAVAALGVAELVKSFSGFNAGEILAIAVALGVFGATMVGLGYMLVLAAPAIGGAAIPLLAFGAAMLMMGGAVAIAALGLSMATPHLLALVTGLAPHAGAMIQMGIALPLMGIGFGAMALGLGGLALALKFIKTKDLIAIADMAKGLSDFGTSIAAEFTAAIEGIAAFVKAVDDISSSDVEVFQTLKKSVIPILSSPVTPGVGKEMHGLSRAAIDYARANARLKVDADDDAFVALVKALKGAINTAGGGTPAAAAGGGGGNTIVLQLNGREFARAVGVAIDSRHDVRMDS